MDEQQHREIKKSVFLKLKTVLFRLKGKFDFIFVITHFGFLLSLASQYCSLSLKSPQIWLIKESCALTNHTVNHKWHKNISATLRPLKFQITENRITFASPDQPNSQSSQSSGGVYGPLMSISRQTGVLWCNMEHLMTEHVTSMVMSCYFTAV